MKPTQMIKLRSDANLLRHEILATKNIGEKLNRITNMLTKYYELGQQSIDIKEVE